MVLDIFQLLMSDVTHLKRLKRLEIYWKFQSLLEFLSPQQVIFPGKFPETENLKGGHISRSRRIAGNVCKGQVATSFAASQPASASPTQYWVTGP